MIKIVSPEIIYYVAAGNIVILILLVDNFARLYNRLESDFTLGLLLFAVLLLTKNVAHALLTLPQIIIANIHTSSVMDTHSLGVVLIPDLLEFVALCIFLYLTRKY